MIVMDWKAAVIKYILETVLFHGNIIICVQLYYNSPGMWPLQFENQVLCSIICVCFDFEIFFDLHVGNTFAFFQKIPLWPNHGDVFHYDKFNISNSSETSSLPLEITLNHKVCLNINCLQFIYIWYLILGLYSNRTSI